MKTKQKLAKTRNSDTETKEQRADNLAIKNLNSDTASHHTDYVGQV